MKRQLPIWIGVLAGALLAGCQSSRVIGNAPSVETAPVAMVSLAEFRRKVEMLPLDAGAVQLADQLHQFDLVSVDETHREDAGQLVDGLVKRLRAAVQNEAKLLHKEALKTPNFIQGSEKARQAAEVIATYPLSGDAASMIEAAALAQSQSSVMTQLGLIRRKRYNLWAMEELQNAQKVIDGAPYPSLLNPIDVEKKKARWTEAQKAATEMAAQIEFSLLEPVAKPFYDEVVAQLGDGKKDFRRDLLKRIVDPNATRKVLEDF